MAMNKAIVASNIGWSTEIIEDGVDGFLVHPKEHETFARRIVEVLEDLDLRINFGNAAREKARLNFSKEVIAAKNLAFYESVIQNNKKN